ncbi:carbamoyltransferase C-terminal domain-containing protein [Streptomyces sp. NPDC002659]|uniref:carbamoyltransferase C-terminal domain-containing protein n=1 Tax=Streptomyces sp. NPDC002659 TaxID=3364656 RepID=UPI003699F776
MWILGLNAPPMGWHDPAACLIDGDGTVHALIEEERITRRKHGLHAHPTNAAQACLDLAGLTPADIDVVALGWDLPRHASRTDLGRLDPPLPGRPWQFGDSRKFLTTALGWELEPVRHPDLVCVPHHYAHAASSFYASGYQEAAVVVVDGYGDDESASIYEARHGRPLVRRDRWPIPHSLGHLYNAVSELIGLHMLEAGKTMGLAAYGRAASMEPWPIFELTGDTFSPPFHLPANTPDRQIILAWWDHFRKLGYGRQHTPSDQLDKNEHAVRLAWSAQDSLQQVCALLAERARRTTGHGALCLAGGVALNCSSNGLLPQPVYVPPVPHDAGVALGAAWTIAPPRTPGQPLTPYLGRAIATPETDETLSRHGLTAWPLSPDEVGERLINGQMGAIVTGRAEIGPRALCHRSIIASPHDPLMRDRLNLAKGRELWRPLSPVGLAEAEDAYWTANPALHRYMLGAAQVTDRGHKDIPAAVHVDGTARPQIITDPDEPLCAVLQHLKSAGAPPVLINTSFNLRGEPVVDTAEDAIGSARAIGLDFLILGDHLIDLPDRKKGR